MPDCNISIHNFPDTSSTTTLPTSSSENDTSTTKISSSEEDLYDASIEFLRQHLKRKSEYDFKSKCKYRKYSDTLLFEFTGSTKTKVKFLQLDNVQEFDKVIKLESCFPDKTLSNVELLPIVKKRRSNLSNLFNKSKHKNVSKSTTSQSSGRLFNILRKLSPKSSKEDIKSKSNSEEAVTSQSPTITSNSSFPSIIATIPSNLIIETSKDLENNNSRFIVTNVWPPRNFKTTLTDIEESPRKSSKNNNSTKSKSTINEEEDLKLNLTYKNDYCSIQYSDSEWDLTNKSEKYKVKKISSKLSVCSEVVESDEEYTDLSTDSEEIDPDMLSPSPSETTSNLLENDDDFSRRQQIKTIVDNLVTQLKARNINCVFNNLNKDVLI